MTRHYLTDTDMERLHLFVWELRQLSLSMRRSNHPDAERLENLLQRFQAETEYDRPQARG